MNFRVVDEHGRQLGTGRNLAALKAELGGQARSAFQALAALKVAAAPRRRRRAGADGVRPRRRRAAASPSPRPRGAPGRDATPPGPSASCPS